MKLGEKAREILEIYLPGVAEEPCEIFLAPEIPEERLAGAEATYGCRLRGGERLALVDETWSGSGKRGFLFLEEGYYFTAGEHILFQSYADLAGFTSGVGYRLNNLNRMLSLLKDAADEAGQTPGTETVMEFEPVPAKPAPSIQNVCRKLSAALRRCLPRTEGAKLPDTPADGLAMLAEWENLACWLNPELLASRKALPEEQREILGEKGTSLHQELLMMEADGKRLSKLCKGCAGNLHRVCTSVLPSSPSAEIRRALKKGAEELVLLNRLTEKMY